MDFNTDKFHKLVHYICSKCDDQSTLGATKLNKILWFSDVLSYINWSSPITGETYLKRQFGPVPSRILATLENLQANSLITVREANYLGYAKKEYISNSEPDISVFSSDEISLIDDVIGSVTQKHTARSISDLTHNDVWEMAGIGETIPYESIFVSRLGEIDEIDVTWAGEQLDNRVA